MIRQKDLIVVDLILIVAYVKKLDFSITDALIVAYLKMNIMEMRKKIAKIKLIFQGRKENKINFLVFVIYASVIAICRKMNIITSTGIQSLLVTIGFMFAVWESIKDEVKGMIKW